MPNMATAWFSGSFFANDVDVPIPADCADPKLFMLEWVANGHRGCLWFQFGTRTKGVTYYADGSSKETSKVTLEPKRYYIGGTVIPLDKITERIFSENMRCNFPDAIAGIKLRNGWGQPLMAEDEILEVPNA